MSAVRWIHFDQCENFRDLGGHRTGSGASTRYGRLYRSDTLESLSDEDHRRFAQLGIVTVIDLRASSEITRRGRIDLTRQPVRYVHLPLVDVVGDPTAWDPVEAARPGYPIEGYRQMLSGGADRLAEVLRVLAEPDALPAVFHCISGKDRTGLVAAVLLGLLGVAAGDVAAEYALSEGRNGHSSASPELKRRFPLVFGAPPATMLAVLAGIEQEHGSIAAYAASLGVDEPTVLRLRAALLDETD